MMGIKVTAEDSPYRSRAGTLKVLLLALFTGLSYLNSLHSPEILREFSGTLRTCLEAPKELRWYEIRRLLT
jgi:hypothetical protein